MPPRSQAFEQGLTADGLAAILAPVSHGSGDLVMPRFKFDTGVGLNDVLAAMGMPEVFTTAADLSGIDGARDLSVDTAIHARRPARSSSSRVVDPSK